MSRDVWGATGYVPLDKEPTTPVETLMHAAAKRIQGGDTAPHAVVNAAMCAELYRACNYFRRRPDDIIDIDLEDDDGVHFVVRVSCDDSPGAPPVRFVEAS